jgi:hypothetical protein
VTNRIVGTVTVFGNTSDNTHGKPSDWLDTVMIPAAVVAAGTVMMLEMEYVMK